MRLEEDELEALRRWGKALQEAGGAELAPAGRAILMLLGEVERLRLELALRRPRQADSASAEAAAEPGEALGATLRGRVQRATRRDSGSSLEDRREVAEGMGSDAEGQEVTTSPEAWIESLRRQD
jgi:hypothetical protein